MKNDNGKLTMLAGAILLAGLPALAADKTNDGCPQPVQSAVAAAYPESRIVSCADEQEDGASHWDVVLLTKDKQRIELDLSAEGTITNTEVAVALEAVPAAVLQAFKAKFPGAKATSAAKETGTTGVFYEITFGKRAAKFSETGAFVEVEREDEDSADEDSED